LIESANYFPKPLYYLMFGIKISTVVCMLLPILQVYLLCPFKQKVKLILIKDGQNICRKYAMKSL
jgi:hypothetical protein